MKDENKLNHIKNIINEDKTQNNNNIELLEDKKISITLSIPYNLNNEIIEVVKAIYGINQLKNMNMVFKTDLTIKDLFEIKLFSDFFDKLSKFHLIIQGITIEFKLFLLNMLEFFYANTKNDDLYKIINQLKVYFSWRESFVLEGEIMIRSVYKILNDVFNKNNDLDKLVEGIQKLLIYVINMFLDDKVKKLIEIIDFDNFSVILPLYMFDVLFLIKTNIKGLNETMKNTIIQNK